MRTIEQLERELLARDFLYDDPTAYREGVLAVTDALRSDRPEVLLIESDRRAEAAARA